MSSCAACVIKKSATMRSKLMLMWVRLNAAAATATGRGAAAAGAGCAHAAARRFPRTQTPSTEAATTLRLGKAT